MQIAGKTVLVTGGAGFIGSHVVDRLAGCRVRVVDDFSTGRRENLARHVDNPRVEIREGDLRDRVAIDDVMRDIDVVFHLACRGVRHSLGHPLENHEINATVTLNVLAAARTAGVTRFVYVSSSEVYGTAPGRAIDEHHVCFPHTVYGASKLAGEAYTRAYHRSYGLPVVVVRPFNSYGPRSHYEGDAGEVIPRFCVWALNGLPPVIFGDGNQTRDFTYVEDTAAGIQCAAECDALVGDTVNVGSGRETSVRQLAAIIYEEAGGVVPPPRLCESRPGDVERLVADVRRARALMGFEPRVTLRDGLRRLLDYLRAREGGPAALLDAIPETNWRVAT